VSDVGTGGVARTLVVGECLADLAPASTAERGDGPASSGKVADWARRLVAMPGGGPANIAVGLARLGVPTAFAGRFSRAGFGPWLRSYLVANGLDLTLSVDASEDATLALVTLDEQGRASYTFYGPGTADWQWQANELPDLSATAPADLGISAVHTGSIALTLEPGAAALAEWLAGLRLDNRVLVSFDPNMRPSLVGDLSAYRARLPRVIASSHIVKASDEDVEVLYPGAAGPEVADRWLSEGVSLVVITAGPLGATAFHQNGASAHCTPPSIEVADTIGAGDSFSAGLLAYFAKYGLLEPAALTTLTESQLREALAQAVSASALTCTRPGADPPTVEELAQFIAERASQ
jgi:fructokinase